MLQLTIYNVQLTIMVEILTGFLEFILQYIYIKKQVSS